MVGRIRKIYKNGLEMIMAGRIRKVNHRTDQKDSWQDGLGRFMVGRIRKIYGMTDQKDSWQGRLESSTDLKDL